MEAGKSQPIDMLGKGLLALTLDQGEYMNRYQGVVTLDGSTLEEIARNYFRNATLIDLSKTPEEIQKKVMTSYHEQAGKKKTKLLDFFIEKRLKNLLENIGDF